MVQNNSIDVVVVVSPQMRWVRGFMQQVVFVPLYFIMLTAPHVHPLLWGRRQIPDADKLYVKVSSTSVGFFSSLVLLRGTFYYFISVTQHWVLTVFKETT